MKTTTAKTVDWGPFWTQHERFERATRRLAVLCYLVFQRSNRKDLAYQAGILLRERTGDGS